MFSKLKGKQLLLHGLLVLVLLAALQLNCQLNISSTYASPQTVQKCKPVAATPTTNNATPDLPSQCEVPLVPLCSPSETTGFNNGVWTVHLVYNDGTPVPNYTITLTSLTGILSATTDLNGQAIISPVQAQTQYLITILSPHPGGSGCTALPVQGSDLPSMVALSCGPGSQEIRPPRFSQERKDN